MKLGKLTVLTASALLAGGISIAAAQSTMAPGESTGAANPQGQCWDAVSKTVKNKSGSAAGAHTPGGVTTDSSASGQSTNTKGTGDSKASPTNTANLPAC